MLPSDLLVSLPLWRCDKTSAATVADLGLIRAFSILVFFQVESYQSLKTMVHWWLPAQPPGLVGLALVLAGPVSVYQQWYTGGYPPSRLAL